MAILSVKNLSLGYNNSEVIRNLSFSINEGDFLLIVGSNGAGKSTLIKGIIGELKPKKGKIEFAGGLAPKFIGFLPQESGLDPDFPATVFEIVMSGSLNRLGHKLFYSKTEKSRAKEKMELLKISDLKSKSFAELSGGQKQKVLLARSLVASEKLLILDEPSNNLDQTSRAEIYKILQDLNKNGLTIIMVTHDLDHGNLIGNKILALREKIFFGETEDFINEIHGSNKSAEKNQINVSGQNERLQEKQVDPQRNKK